MTPGERLNAPRWRDTDASETFYVIATEPSRSCPGATNYRLARIVDGRAVRAAALANGTIRRPAPRAPAPCLASDYWGFRHAAEDIYLEFNEGRTFQLDDGSQCEDNGRALKEIVARRKTHPVVAARLAELLAGADDWDIARAKRFDETAELRAEFCDRQADSPDDQNDAGARAGL